MLAKFLRSLGHYPGRYHPGPLNCICDVPGLKVGHITLIEGSDIRTGVTAVLPHDGDLFHECVPAGLAVGNGFGKMAGVSQIKELGELETPLLLTNTLAVPRGMEAIIDWTLGNSGPGEIRSINAVVGETNDGYLNDIRQRRVAVEHCLAAIESAVAGRAVAEGAVGAGTGTVCFGWKGGIGSSSRILDADSGRYSVGALVQTNFGGDLRIFGVPVGQILGDGQSHWKQDGGGSIMIILATDAPVSSHDLHRLAWRGFGGLARCGSNLAHGSGDYALAFSTAETVRRLKKFDKRTRTLEEVSPDILSRLFHMAIEAVEEAIYNSLFAAKSMNGYKGRRVEALPKDKVGELLAH